MARASQHCARFGTRRASQRIEVAACHRDLASRAAGQHHQRDAGLQYDRNGIGIKDNIEVAEYWPLTEQHRAQTLVFVGMKTVARSAPQDRRDACNALPEFRLLRVHGGQVGQ